MVAADRLMVVVIVPAAISASDARVLICRHCSMRRQ
jgi:hypothetical protein